MLSILKCCTNRLQTTSVTTIFRRRYIKVSDKMEILLKQADNIPRNFELIYRQKQYRMGGIMYHSVNFIACLTVGSSAYAWYAGSSVNPELNDNVVPVITNPIQGVILVIAILTGIIAASVFRRRYPIRVYYNPTDNVYRAIFIGKFPFSTEYHEFSKGSVSFTSQDSLLPWRRSLFHANGRKMFLYDEYFRSQSELTQMLRSEI